MGSRWWTWDAGEPRAVERLWRFTDPSAADLFQVPAYDGTPLGERIDEVLTAIRTAGISYTFELPYRGGPRPRQPIRPPATIWRAREATCMDIVLMAASALLHAGVRTWIVVGKDPEGTHAWVVADTAVNGAMPCAAAPGDESIDAWEEHHRPDGLVDDPAAFAAMIAAEPKRYLPIDVSVLLRGYPDGDDRASGTIGMAEDSGTELMDGGGDLAVCDVSSWWCEQMLIPPPSEEHGDAGQPSWRRRYRWHVAVPVVAALVLGASILRGSADGPPDGGQDPSDRPVTATDLRPEWIDGEHAVAFRVDPLRGIVDGQPINGTFIGMSTDGRSVWTHDETAVVRWSARTGKEVSRVELTAPRFDDAVIVGAAVLPEGAAVLRTGDGGVAVDWMDAKGAVANHRDWRYEGPGRLEFLDGVADDDGSETVFAVRAAAADDGSVAEGPVTVVRLRPAGPAATAELEACTGVSVWTGSGRTAIACESTVTVLDDQLQEVGSIALPPTSGLGGPWQFASADLLSAAHEADPSDVLMWAASGGLATVDLTELAVRRQTPYGSALLDGYDEGAKQLVEVWAAPAERGSTRAVARTSRDGPDPESVFTYVLEGIGRDLDAVTYSTTLPTQASNAAVQWADGRPILVLSGAWCCTLLNVATLFVDPSSGTVLSRSNPAEDAIVVPAEGGYWLLQVGRNSLDRIFAESGRREGVLPRFADGDGADGAPPSHGSIEYASESDVVVRFWDEGAWHVVRVDPETGTLTALGEASSTPEVRVSATGDRSAWIRESRSTEPLTTEYRFRRVDLATGRELASTPFTPGVPPSWFLAEDGQPVLWRENHLVRLDAGGRAVQDVDLSTQTVDVVGAPNQLALKGPEDPTDPIGEIAGSGGQVMMLWAATMYATPHLVSVDPVTLLPTGPAHRLVDAGNSLANRILEPVDGGFAVGFQYGRLLLYDGASVTERVEVFTGFRTFDGAVSVFGSDGWTWTDTVDPEDAKRSEADCDSGIDQVLRSDGRLAYLCPATRTLHIGPGSDGGKERVLDY